MRRKIGFAGAIVSAIILVLGLITWVSAASEISGHETIHVVERPGKDHVVDIGKPGDSFGDVFTFADPAFDATNSNKVGRIQGRCIRTDPGHARWECSWTTILKGGAISVEGPFYDNKDSIAAVTGGTGVYRNARGSVEQHYRGNFEYDAIFHLTD